MTRITVTDPVLIEQLRRARTGVLRDPEGRLLGSFAVAAPHKLQGGDKPPADGVVPPQTPLEAKS